MRYTFLFISILLSALVAFDIPSPGNSYYHRLHRSKVSVTHHYTGLIGGKYQLLMNLEFRNDTIDGQYRYYTQKDFIQVKGIFNSSTKKFNLEESTSNKKKGVMEVTGFFDGTQNGKEISGTWFNKDRTKSFDFVLSTDEQPMPTFIIYDNSHIDDSMQAADSIVISFNSKSQQLITGFEAYCFEGFPYITQEDINFDGYLDLLILLETGARNAPYKFYVFDPAASRFVEHPELEEAVNPVIDVQNKVIRSDWTGGAAEYGTNKYIYQNGSFYLIEEEQRDLSTNKSTVTKYKIVDGKSVKQ